MFKAVGTIRDSIYTIDLSTGIATPIGRTGFNIVTNDLAFDENNILYGVIGASNATGKLIEINTTTAAGTEIGEIGFVHVVGLGYSLNGPITSIEEDKEVLPKEFSLAQNYPNPFNPSTRIEYSLPASADVELTVFNILGQQVALLLNQEQSAGTHSITWNAEDSNGLKLSSGIYFYKLKATTANGIDFLDIKKMILLK